MLTFEVQRENCSSSIAAAALGRFGMSAHSTSGLRNSALHVPDNIYIMTTDAACRHPESVTLLQLLLLLLLLLLL